MQDIKLAHSVFALPFAASTLLFFETVPNLHQGMLLLLCMVTARSFAMGMNRLLDAKVDLLNPRTKSRMIPAGKLSVSNAIAINAICALMFVIAAFMLSSLAGYCSIPLLFVLALYPKWKRWSWLTHWYLGICLGLSPVAVEVALLGTISMQTILVGLGVALWTGGFDVIYALLDREFDLRTGVKSAPVSFGVRGALLISRFSFCAAIICWSVVGILAELSWIYFAGVSFVATLLMIEQLIVAEATDVHIPKTINAAFFNLNACVSVAFFVFLVAEKVLT
jgi:4-hydroxybenzoate polyprenyltransferase